MTDTAPGALRRAVERAPDAVAVTAPDGAGTTWAALDADARRFGAALVERGVRPGDRVAIWAPNGPRWIVAVFGLWQAGATLVPVNTRFKGAEAADVLRRSGARVLVTVTDFLGVDHVAMLADELAHPRGDGPTSNDAALGHLGLVVVADGPPSTAAVGDARHVSWDELLADVGDDAVAELDDRAERVGPDDVSDILYTSGTTGRPKGVVQTHARTLCVAADWVAMTGLSASDRYLMVNPYFHMFGLKAGILASTVAGATMVPVPVFDVDGALQRVQDERITVLPGAPTLYQGLLDAPDRDRFDLTSLRIAVTGAADIPVELVHRIRAELPFRMVLTGYGLTEGGTVAATGPDDDAETVATTVGRARPSFELRLVGDQVPSESGPGAVGPSAVGPGTVGPGEVGEIVVRGASVMREYLDDPAATAEVLDADGWLRTGDLGTVDERGNLRIVGRSKDMFIVGGFNVYPAEVENLLLGHPDIAQVAVVGIADDRMGEVGAAFVVARPGVELDEADLIAWSRGRMANYKAPRRVVAVEELPVNATGKVVKDELRTLVESP